MSASLGFRHLRCAKDAGGLPPPLVACPARGYLLGMAAGRKPSPPPQPYSEQEGGVALEPARPPELEVLDEQDLAIAEEMFVAAARVFGDAREKLDELGVALQRLSASLASGV